MVISMAVTLVAAGRPVLLDSCPPSPCFGGQRRVSGNDDQATAFECGILADLRNASGGYPESSPGRADR